MNYLKLDNCINLRQVSFTVRAFLMFQNTMLSSCFVISRAIILPFFITERISRILKSFVQSFS